MSMNATAFTVEGLGNLTKKLQGLKEDIRRTVGREAIKNGSQILLHEARSLAPVDSGRLVGSLKVRVKTKEGGEDVFIAEIFANPGKGRDDPNGAYYAHMVELGTKRMAARPFMRTAFETKGEEALGVVASTLTTRFQKMGI